MTPFVCAWAAAAKRLDRYATDPPSAEQSFMEETEATTERGGAETSSPADAS
jgi:hypothetical protein